MLNPSSNSKSMWYDKLLYSKCTNLWTYIDKHKNHPVFCNMTLKYIPSLKIPATYITMNYDIIYIEWIPGGFDQKQENIQKESWETEVITGLVNFCLE